MASRDDRRERSQKQPIESIVEDNREVHKPIDREKVNVATFISVILFPLSSKYISKSLAEMGDNSSSPVQSAYYHIFLSNKYQLHFPCPILYFKRS